MADFEDIFASLQEALTRGTERARVTRKCDFRGYSDTDLLQMPATTIVNERRAAALGGRTYVSGDNCSSDIAVVRIPDEERMITDFKPHLDWSASNPARTPRVGKFRINRNLANRGIAPRLAEPAPPEQTKTGVFAATEEDTPLAPIERAVLRGGQCIQIVKKSGGDHDALARLLGRIWGDEALFDSAEEMDLLGDVSLPRVLAREGKRRFEIYRNIGFTSLVSAGSSTANQKAYGDSSVINWQKRVELSKLFLHFAQALEGGKLVPGSQFSITTRIPAYTVPHVIWEDLALDVSPEVYPVGIDLSVYTQRARGFIRTGMHAALVAVSEFIRARAGMLADDMVDAIATVAGRYDKLTFMEEIPKFLAPKIHRPELAYAHADSLMKIDPVVYKAHDVRTAVLECLADNVIGNQDAANTVATLNAMIQVAEHQTPAMYGSFINRILAEVPYIFSCARVVADRPATYEDRHRKAIWSQLVTREIPKVLIDGRDPYDATLIARATLHTIFKDPTSQARRKVKHLNGLLRETLDTGIRRKRTLLSSSDAGVTAAIHAEIHVTNRRFYRERYRKPAKVWSIYAESSKDSGDIARGRLAAAWWYARSDAAHSSVLNEENGAITARLPDKRLKSVLSVYLSHLKPLLTGAVEKLGDKQDVWEYTKTVADPAVAKYLSTFSVDSLRNHIESYCDAQARDHEPVEVVVPGIMLTPAVAQQEIDDLLKTADHRNISFKASIDQMVSTWANLCGATSWVDEDDLDSMISWMEENLGAHVDRVEWYVKTHSEDLDEDRAQELFDEWFEKWEDHKDEVTEHRRGEIV